MANRPKGSVLRTSVIQAKLTPQLNAALNKFADSESKSVSTIVCEILEETLKTKGYLRNFGFVYLLKNEDIYEIGITNDLMRRLNQLKPDEIINTVKCSNYESLELLLHKKFKKYRIPQTEYFRLTPNLVEQVSLEMTKEAET